MLRADQLFSCLPGVITEYDGKTATVRPLIQMKYKDGSALDFPEITDVPIITPATAFSGMKFPVQKGDKVVLHIADRDIQALLLETTTSGLEDPGSVAPTANRTHNLTDAIAYTGFQSAEDMKYSEEYKGDVWIFNNDNSDSYNHIRLTADGAIELRTLNTSVEATKDGELNVVAPVSVTIDTPTLNVTGNIDAGGDIDSAGTISAIAEVTALAGAIKLSTHTHTSAAPGIPTSTPLPS